MSFLTTARRIRPAANAIPTSVAELLVAGNPSIRLSRGHPGKGLGGAPVPFSPFHEKPMTVESTGRLALTTWLESH